MNRDILRITIPSIISNITVPLLEIVSIAIAGRCGDIPAVSIGQLAIGVAIFNFICWNFNFLRMGTSGMTAQAFGARDFAETTRMLLRSLSVGLLLGGVIILLRTPLTQYGVLMMGGSDIATEYLKVRIWSIPAEILFFALHGWYTGMQNATIPMTTSLIVDVLHISLSLWFALSLNMGIVGIAYASVVAQWAGVVVSALLLAIVFRRHLVRVTLREVFKLREMLRFFSINRDVIIRTMLLNGAYTLFTAASARMGEPIILAVNALLMQIVMLFSYLTDSIAYAAEALVGRYIGERNEEHLRVAIGKCCRWALGASVIYSAIYFMSWEWLLGLFIEDSHNLAETVSVAREYVGWIFVIPLAGALPFIMDGIMVGATQSVTMRNAMIISVGVYFGVYFAARPLLGNNALWLAYTAFTVSRGLSQYILSRKLEDIYSLARNS